MDKPKGSLIAYMANKVKAQGGINLAQGIPAFDPPKQLTQMLSKIAFDSLHQYAPGRGNYLLLEQLSLHYIKPTNQFLVVNGATEALSTIFTYLIKQFPDASVLSFDPAYESYKHLPRLFNRPFYALNFDANEQIDFEILENQIKSKWIKIIMLASPGNPWGRIFSQTEMEQLIALVNKHDVYLIVDAVYSDLYFDEKPWYPLDSITKNVFYVNAFSKKLSITGWRLGYLLAHESHIDGLMDVHDYIGLSSPSVLHQAVALYLKENDFGHEYTSELRALLSDNYKQMSTALSQLGFEVLPAQGGYFVWCKLPKGYSSGLNFAFDLYEAKKVAVVPGEHFSENGQQMIRLNIARHSYEISMAISKIKEFVCES